MYCEGGRISCIPEVPRPKPGELEGLIKIQVLLDTSQFLSCHILMTLFIASTICTVA